MPTLTETYRTATLDLAEYATRLQSDAVPFGASSFDDDVRGVIVGGDFLSWKLYYGDKSMDYRRFTSDTEAEALETARQLKREYLAAMQYVDPTRYTDDSQWHIRIWG